jgi:hypothetical protein
MVLPAYSPPKEGVLRFLLSLKSIASTGFEITNRGSNGKHANHYKTEDDKFHIAKCTVV